MSSAKRWLLAGAAIAVALAAADAVAIAAGMEDEASVTNSVVIERPPEVVFDYASDMRHELEWNPDVETMQKLTGGPVGLGTRFAAKWKQSDDVVVELKHFDRPRGFSMVNGGPLEVAVDIQLAPQGAGTLFTSRFTARPHGFFKLIFPIFKRMMARFELANMGHLKRAIEARPPAPR